MAARGRRQRRKRDDGIDVLLAAPWWISIALAAVAYVALAKLLPAMLPASSSLRAGLTPALTLLGAVFAGLLCVIGVLAWLRQRPPRGSTVESRPPARAAPPPATLTSAATSRDPLDELARIRQQAQGEQPAGRPAAWSIDVLRRMEWKRFEHVVAGYYARCGFRAELQTAGADGGVDVRLYRGDSPAPIALVQCKAWDSRAVGVAPVRELLGVMTIEQVNAGIFVTSGSYSADAAALSGAHKLRLITGEELLGMIRALPDAAQTELLAIATTGDWTTPTCPSCGTPMVRRERSSDGNPFWGCARFPACRQTFALRAGDATP